MDQWLEEIRAALPELVVYQQEPITIIVMEMSCSLFLIQTTITVQRMRMS